MAGTPVKTAAGYAPIESLKVGDLVQSEDPKTGAISLRRVTQVHVRPIEKINTFYKLTVSKDGAEEDFYVTGEHPFWIADKAEWRSVDELSVGDTLADFGGHSLRVSAKAPVSEKQQTYNISVEGNATYFAGRSEVLVHNINCGNLPVGYAINADGTVTAQPQVKPSWDLGHRFLLAIRTQRLSQNMRSWRGSPQVDLPQASF